MTQDGGGTAVTRDMERVFAGLGTAARTAQTAPAPTPRPQSTRSRAGRGTGAWAIMLAVVIGAIGGLAFVLWRLAAPATTPTAMPPMLPEAASRAPDRLILRAPNPVPPLRSDVPEIDALSAPIAPRSSPSAGLSAQRTLTVPVRPHRREGGRAMAVPSGPAASSASQVRSPAADAASVVSSCRGAHDQAGCFYKKVMEADARVRRAYDAATISGTPVSYLRGIRSSWKRALSRSRKEPLVSVGTLNGLTASLQDELHSPSKHSER